MNALVDVVVLGDHGPRIQLTLEGLLRQTVHDLRIQVIDRSLEDNLADSPPRLPPSGAQVDIRRGRPGSATWGEAWDVVQHGTAPFTMLTSDRETHEPEFVERCLAACEDASVVLAYAASDRSEAKQSPQRRGRVDTVELSRLGRYNVALWSHSADSAALHGLVKRNALERLTAWPASLRADSADWLLLCELAMLGGFAYVPEVLLHRNVDAAPAGAVRVPIGDEAIVDWRTLPYRRRLGALAALVKPHADSPQQALSGYLSAALRSAVPADELLSQVQ